MIWKTILRTAITMAMLFSLSIVPIAHAQSDTGAENTGSTVDAETTTPQFGLRPVGDHPNGYFDDVVVNPGETVTLTVSVMNVGEIPVELRTYKINANNAPNGGYLSAPQGEEERVPNSWVDYPTITVALDPGRQQDVSFTVTVPEDTPPGQYISGLAVETAEALAVPGTTAIDQVLSYAISLGILVPGEIEQSFELGEPEIIADDSSVRLSIPVTNAGNYLVRPAGELELRDDSGKVIVGSSITMGSVYMNNSTTVEVHLPNQIAPGEYELSLMLSDPESGATASIDDVAVTVPEMAESYAVVLVEATISPNAEDIVFADVSFALENGGQRINAVNAVLEVSRDGDVVENFSIATNQVLVTGENVISSRYIPADGTWPPGTYTFNLVVSAVDPEGDERIELLSYELDIEIVVP